MKEEELISRAREARRLSYSPYSGFAVGAVVITKDGTIYEGANIENASYSLCMCAERNALYNAYCHGARKEDIEALCVVADTAEPVSPCGACRQVMSELVSEDAQIILASLNGEKKITTIKELLPGYFKGEDMK